MLSVVFLWAYVLVARRFENRLISRKYIVEKGFRPHGWILIAVGVVFSSIHIGAIVFSEFEHGIFAAIFVWFCIHGIFAVMVLRIVWGLFECLKQMKEHEH